MHFHVAVTIAFVSCCAVTRAEDVRHVSVDELNSNTVKIDGVLRRPLGEIVTIEGVIHEGPTKGYRGGPNLAVQRINGVATQDKITVPVHLTFTVRNQADKLVDGKTFEIRGYESGEYVGIPYLVHKEFGYFVQCSDHYFQTSFNGHTSKAIDPIVLGPGDFAVQKALFEGVAKSSNKQSIIEGKNWKIVAKAEASWPAAVEGKSVECYGTYKADSTDKNKYALDGKWRLVKLEDQMNAIVELRGYVRCFGNTWMLNYRGSWVHLELPVHLDGWTQNNNYRAVVIRGVLSTKDMTVYKMVTESLPIDNVKQCYSISKLSWEPAPIPITSEFVIQEE